MTEEVSGIVVALGEDGVQRITIDRVEVGNSLSPLARDALTEAFLHADSNPAVRAVLLSAAGTRHFCAWRGPGSATCGERAATDGGKTSRGHRPNAAARMAALGRLGAGL